MTRRVDDASPFDCVSAPACPRVVHNLGSGASFSVTLFDSGTFADVQVIGGRALLQEEYTWGLAYNGPRTRAGAGVVFAGKLVFLAMGAPTNDTYLYVFDGTAWSAVLVLAGGAEEPGIGHRQLVAIDATLYIGCWRFTAANAPPRKTQDLSSFSDYGDTSFGRPRLTVHGGVLYELEYGGAGLGPFRDNGVGNWTDLPDISNPTGGESYQNLLYTTNNVLALVAWNGTAWVNNA